MNERKYHIPSSEAKCAEELLQRQDCFVGEIERKCCLVDVGREKFVKWKEIEILYPGRETGGASTSVVQLG